MNDDTQTGYFAINSILALAVQLHKLQCVAGRAVG
jgi:hypothetical protein